MFNNKNQINLSNSVMNSVHISKCYFRQQKGSKNMNRNRSFLFDLDYQNKISITGVTFKEIKKSYQFLKDQAKCMMDAYELNKVIDNETHTIVDIKKLTPLLLNYAANDRKISESDKKKTDNLLQSKRLTEQEHQFIYQISLICLSLFNISNNGSSIQFKDDSFKSFIASNNLLQRLNKLILNLSKYCNEHPLFILFNLFFATIICYFCLILGFSEKTIIQGFMESNRIIKSSVEILVPILFLYSEIIIILFASGLNENSNKSRIKSIGNIAIAIGLPICFAIFKLPTGHTLYDSILFIWTLIYSWIISRWILLFFKNVLMRLNVIIGKMLLVLREVSSTPSSASTVIAAVLSVAATIIAAILKN